MILVIILAAGIVLAVIVGIGSMIWSDKRALKNFNRDVDRIAKHLTRKV